MIADEILAGRLPRLGSITTGRGVEAEARSGKMYSKPTRSDTLVLHTDDDEVAAAAHLQFGGDIREDSPNWSHDVVTAVRSIDLMVLVAGWRQALESWRAAECVRRCDGVQTSMVSGKPDARPCLCEPEMDRGQDRACTPHTVLPALMDLDVERWGVWEIRSTGWGSAANLKGTVRALAMVGISSGSVPARLSMVDRTTRDSTGQVREVTDLALTIATSQTGLAELATQAASLPSTAPAALPSGDAEVRLRAMEVWSDLQGRGHRLGLRDTMLRVWRDRFGQGRTVEDLDIGELVDWTDEVGTLVRDAEQAIREEQAETGGAS